MKLFLLISSIMLMAGARAAAQITDATPNGQGIPRVSILCSNGTSAVPCTFGGSATLSSPQQAMQPGVTPVTVAANTSVLVWTANASARTLKIIPEANNASCRLNDTGAAASASVGYAIPGGYVWNLIEPPPTANIYAFCTTGGVLDVSQGN